MALKQACSGGLGPENQWRRLHTSNPRPVSAPRQSSALVSKLDPNQIPDGRVDPSQGPLRESRQYQLPARSCGGLHDAEGCLSARLFTDRISCRPTGRNYLATLSSYAASRCMTSKTRHLEPANCGAVVIARPSKHGQGFGESGKMNIFDRHDREADAGTIAQREHESAAFRTMDQTVVFMP